MTVSVGSLSSGSRVVVWISSQGALVGKNLPPSPAQEMQETWVRSLGGEDPLEKGMATHSSLLAWGSPWTEELGEL